jgi:hypothetical protein
VVIANLIVDLLRLFGIIPTRIYRDNIMSQEEHVEHRLKALEAENEKMKDKLDRIKLLIGSMAPVLKNKSA